MKAQQESTPKCISVAHIAEGILENHKISYFQHLILKLL